MFLNFVQSGEGLRWRRWCSGMVSKAEMEWWWWWLRWLLKRVDGGGRSEVFLSWYGSGSVKLEWNGGARGGRVVELELRWSGMGWWWWWRRRSKGWVEWVVEDNCDACGACGIRQSCGLGRQAGRQGSRSRSRNQGEREAGRKE